MAAQPAEPCGRRSGPACRGARGRVRCTRVHVRHELDRPHVPQDPHHAGGRSTGKAIDDAIGLDPTPRTRGRGLWLEAYDADDRRRRRVHLFGAVGDRRPRRSSACSRCRRPPAAVCSLDRLRDFFYPVSPAGRQHGRADPTSGVSDFGLVSDDVLTPGNGLRGVHIVFRYRVGGGPPQMMDQTAYLNDDASKLYLFFVRCSTECYEQRQKEIDTRGVLVHRPGEAMTRTGRRPPGARVCRAPDGDRHAAAPRRRPASRCSLWDRIRLLLLFAVVWLILVWAAMADNPLLPFVDAVRIQLLESQWLLWLVGPRAAAPGPLPHQRALGRLPPVLVEEGVRRRRPGDARAGSPTGPGSGWPG